MAVEERKQGSGQRKEERKGTKGADLEKVRAIKGIKGWDRLREAGVKITEHKLNEEIRCHPWKRSLRPDAPDIAKASIKRDYEVGLVYPITKEIEEARAACGLEAVPPTGHKYHEAVEKKQKLAEEVGICKKIGFDKKKGTFSY